VTADLTARLAGRTALVTGAASGNGLGIARRLLAEGASVVFADVNGALLDEVVSADDGRATAVVADVSSPSSAAEMVTTVLDAYGSLDILVNNAGIVRFSEFDDLSLEEWEEVFRVNSTGPFVVTKAAADALRASAKRRSETASVVNITSTEAHIVVASAGHPQVHYNASKGALHMLNQALAVEFAAAGVRVNAVAPGIVETPFTRRAMENEALLAWYLERIPLGRVAQPSDVGAAVAFLASDDAACITGTTIFVDGGWTAQ